MAQPVITFIVNKKPYRLCSSNVDAIRDMPSEDRQQLIALLDAVKREEAAAQQVAAKIEEPAAVTSAVGTNAVSAHQDVQSERSGSTNVDALMAQLIMEDKVSHKSGLTKQAVYKWVVIVTVLIFTLMFII